MIFDKIQTNDTSGHSSIALKLDEASFEIFFKEYFISLCVFCQCKFHFDLNLAKEVVHTAFIKLWETKSSLTSHSTVKAYLYQIVINNSIDIIRHEKIKKKHQEFILQSFLSHATRREVEPIFIKQMSIDIDKAIAELPEQMRKIFELSKYEGLKYAAIASYLNISVKTVETQMSRALVKLRKKLANYLDSY